MFDVTVYLPKSSRNSPLYVKDFDTDMPLFEHRISALGQTVNFDFVCFRTANMPIHVEVSNKTYL
jgi:hypothetical protein